MSGLYRLNFYDNTQKKYVPFSANDTQTFGGKTATEFYSDIEQQITQKTQTIENNLSGGLSTRVDNVETQVADIMKVTIIAESFPKIIPEVDDKGYVQRAIDSLIGKGGTVYITKPNPQFNTPVVLDTRHQGIAIKGIGWGRGTTVESPIKIQAKTIAFKTETSGSYAVSLANPIRGLEISKLLIMGQDGNHDHLIMLDGIVSAEFNHLYTSGTKVGKDNFQLSNFADITIRHYVVTGSGNNGLNVGDAVFSNSSTSLRMEYGYIGHCRNAGVWGIGAEQMSHVKILGTIFESNGRDGSNNVISGALGIGVIFDNVDDLEIKLYAESNNIADVVIGGTTDTSGNATAGSGCRSVDVKGYFQGLGTGVNAREGLKIIKADGIEVNGYYSGYTHANIAINDVTKTNVKNLHFNSISIGTAPSAIVFDEANRISTDVNPSGYTISGKTSITSNVTGNAGSEITGEYIGLPIMATSDITAITNKKNGMMVYDSTKSVIVGYSGDDFYAFDGGRALYYNSAPPATLPSSYGKIFINVATTVSTALPAGLYNGQIIRIANFGSNPVTITGIFMTSTTVSQGQYKEFMWSSATGQWVFNS